MWKGQWRRIEFNESGFERVERVIFAVADLSEHKRKFSTSFQKGDGVDALTHILTGMKLRTTLTYNDLARQYVLI